MRFYRVTLYTENGLSAGYKFYTSRRDVARAVRAAKQNEPDERVDVETLDIAPTREGILSALRQYASHANNG